MTAVLAHPDVSTLPPLREPRQVGGLHDVFRRRYLLWLLVRKEIKVRYQGSLLGLGWSYVQPLVRFLVYYYIAGLIIGHGTPNRALHIFSGMVIMQFFSVCLSAGAKSVIKNKSLVSKINMPREMFPVASVAVSLYNMFPMYVVLIIGDFVRGWHPDMGALISAILALAIVTVFGLGCAILLGAANVFIRDVGNIVDVINTVIRWTAPVIYTYSMVAPKLAQHPWIQQVYICNPFNNAVMLNNRAFWIPSLDNIPQAERHELPAHMYERGLLVLAACFMFVVVAQLVFSRLDGKFADRL